MKKISAFDMYQSAMHAKADGDDEQAVQFLTQLIGTFPNSPLATKASAVLNSIEGENKNGIEYSTVIDPLQDSPKHQKVVITDIKMPFESMVVFMVKWVIASIPALIILAVFFSIVISIFGGLGG